MVDEIEADEEWRKVAKGSQGSRSQREPMGVPEDLMIVATKERVNICLIQKVGSWNPILQLNGQIRAIPFIS